MAQQHRHSRRSTAAAPVPSRGRSRSAWLRHTAAAAGKRGSTENSASAVFCGAVRAGGGLSASRAGPPTAAAAPGRRAWVGDDAMVDWQQQCGAAGALQQDISPLPLHYQLTADSAAGADSGEGDGKQGSTGGAWLPAPQVLRDAADRVTAAVNRRITSGGAAHLPLEAADHDGWLPSYAVANCYANGDAGLGQHSDRTPRCQQRRRSWQRW